MATDDGRRWWRCIGVDGRRYGVFALTEAIAYRWLNQQWDKRNTDPWIRKEV